MKKTETQLNNLAHFRAAKLEKISRGEPLAPGVDVTHLDDEVLLDDVTRAARDMGSAETTLTDCVKACCQADLDRDDVVEAVMAGGYSASRAKTVVSSVYCDAGKRLRKAGSGPSIPTEALSLAQYAVAHYGDNAKKYLLAAYRAASTKTVAGAAKPVRSAVTVRQDVLSTPSVVVPVRLAA